MDNMNWNYPTPIWFGLNRVNEIQKACNVLKMKNPLIVTDPDRILDAIFLDAVFLVVFLQ